MQVCLNSTMVRLKQMYNINTINIDVVSQFHYGSIKTEDRVCKVFNDISSQFHYGSIKTQRIILYWLINIRLNSTMVRLKLLQAIYILIQEKMVSIPLWFD